MSDTAEALKLNEPMNVAETDTDVQAEVENAQPESEASDAGDESSVDENADAQSEEQDAETEEVAL